LFTLEIGVKERKRGEESLKEKEGAPSIEGALVHEESFVRRLSWSRGT
jgi:hypothetical protein